MSAELEINEPADLATHKLSEIEWQARAAQRRAEAIAEGPPACATCGKATTFAPLVVGLTCGGLWLRGWYMCPDQHGTLASGLSEVCEAPTWTIAKGGRSVDIGTGRIRLGVVKVESGERLDVAGLMTRIARLPELERLALAVRAYVDAEDDDRVPEWDAMVALLATAEGRC